MENYGGGYFIFLNRLSLWQPENSDEVWWREVKKMWQNSEIAKSEAKTRERGENDVKDPKRNDSLG